MSDTDSPTPSVVTSGSALVDMIDQMGDDAAIAALLSQVDTQPGPLDIALAARNSIQVSADDDETETLPESPTLSSELSPVPAPADAIAEQLTSMGLDAETQAQAVGCIPVIDTLLEAKNRAEKVIEDAKAKRSASARKAAATRKARADVRKRSQERADELLADSASLADDVKALADDDESGDDSSSDTVSLRREELAKLADRTKQLADTTKTVVQSQPMNPSQLDQPVDMSTMLKAIDLDSAPSNPVQSGLQLFRASKENATEFVNTATAELESKIDSIPAKLRHMGGMARHLELPSIVSLSKVNLSYIDAMGLLFYSLQVNNILANHQLEANHQTTVLREENEQLKLDLEDLQLQCGTGFDADGDASTL